MLFVIRENRCLLISTPLGDIRAVLQTAAAPVTSAYITDLVRKGVYKKSSFYRSDFVIQCGIHPLKCPEPSLTVNESQSENALSNDRGTFAVAHWDVPDCGNSEFFINLKHNKHLDTAYGGYCVFAKIASDDAKSFSVVDDIAAAKKRGKNTPISSIEIQ